MSYPSISIASLFEDMVKEGKITPGIQTPGDPLDKNMPDLREVPPVDLEQFYGRKNPQKVIQETKVPKSNKNHKDELLELMVEFKQLVKKANTLFTEMCGATTVGAIGTAPQPSLGNKPKNRVKKLLKKKKR